MNNQEILDRVRERARNNYRTGLNCAECVFRAIYDEGVTELPPEIISMATGFGGGIGLSGNTCGAVSGAVLAVGCVHGRKNPEAIEDKHERAMDLSGEAGRYRLFNNIPREFADKFGDAKCANLVGPYEWSSRERHKMCQDFIGEAAVIGMRWILEANEKGYKIPYGPNVAGLE